MKYDNSMTIMRAFHDEYHIVKNTYETDKKYHFNYGGKGPLYLPQ
jgi:hypothetical protein